MTEPILHSIPVTIQPFSAGHTADTPLILQMQDTMKQRRERIATAALTGLATNPDFTNYLAQYSVQMAILAADLLIKELDK